MEEHFHHNKKLTSFQIIILGFAAVILTGALLLIALLAVSFFGTAMLNWARGLNPTLFSVLITE